MTKLLTGLFFTFILLLFVVKCGEHPISWPTSKKSVPAPNPHLEAFVRAYAQFIQSEIQRTQTPGAAVVIVKDSTVVFMQGFGVKALHSRDSVDTHTLFRIGSLSKGFAGILTALLEQENYLSLDDPLIKYLPDFQLNSPEQTKRIQLKHVLSHSTGLPYHTYTNLIETGADIPTISKLFRTVKLVGNEGEVFSYQNAAFSLIEEVIHKAYGKSYAKTIREKLFAKAGMKDASTSFEALTAASNKAYPHDGFDSTWIRTDITKKYYNAIAAGGINASISDMGQWLLLLLGNRPDIIQQSTLNKAFTPIIKTNNERRFFKAWVGDKEAFYGLGWRILHTPQDTIIYHGGYVNSYKGEIALQQSTGIGVCILMNGSGSMSEQVIPGFFERYKLYADSIQAWKPTL